MMATTIVEQYDQKPVRIRAEEIRDALQEILEICRGDEDKADTIEDSVYWGGCADTAEDVLMWMTNPEENTTKEMNSMATKETLDKVETAIDTTNETVETLERIPKLALNGTTKKQQVIILGTVAGTSLIVGVMASTSVHRFLGKFRRNKNRKTIEDFAAGKDV